jgi:predicted Zn finger-like uncharacterized protein
MRFLCEQCKAKYQIADEKVAGKTVRMKCRKCGHLIEVKAEVTETSVSTKAPQPDPPEHEENDATRVGMDVGSMMKLSHGATTKPAAPRPGAPGKPAQVPTAKPALATSLASAKPAARAPSRPPQSSALAGAFQKSVSKDDAGDRAMLEISTSSEWYCAINGVPVGPVRIAELRRKAATGAVNEESLVWQEGMEEWRPLRTIPELVAILHEGLSSERPSLVTPAPAPQRPAPPRAQPRNEPSVAPRQQQQPMASTPQAGAPVARSNVVSLASRLATAEKLEPEEIADPFAIKPITDIDPLAPAPSPLASIAQPAFGSVAAPTVVIPRKQGPNWVVIGMVVAFGAFGAMAGFAVFFRQPPQQAAPTIIMTAAAPAQTNPTAGPLAAATDVANPAQSGDPAVIVRTQTGGGGGTHPATGGGASGTSTARVVDPSIAALLGGPGGGPSVGGGGAGGSASSALSEEAIQRTVQQRSAGVKRTCWERGGGTESNVNVRVHLTIAATGNVQTSSAEGNDPIVSKCIENSVRNWQFPISSGSTTVDIPFHFLRQ